MSFYNPYNVYWNFKEHKRKSEYEMRDNANGVAKNDIAVFFLLFKAIISFGCYPTSWKKPRDKPGNNLRD